MIVHSTFLNPQRFRELIEPIRSACRRGVRLDILWGAERDEETEKENAAAAAAVAEIIRQGHETHGRVVVHMGSTGSHAKILLADRADGTWIAAVGSCNWLYSDFHAVELSVVLRNPHLVAEVATAFSASPIAAGSRMTWQRRWHSSRAIFGKRRGERERPESHSFWARRTTNCCERRAVRQGRDS